jgi:signal transduction histidine kinase
MVDNYPGAISHTVTNLVMNSIIHGFNEMDAGEVKIEARSDGETVTILYGDNGAGMSREIRRQIFDPFFTTRRSLGGSGLGMHVVYNSVTKSLGGSITCASSSGEGSTFTIEFPLRNGSSDDAAR